jgi:hypothetical protein
MVMKSLPGVMVLATCKLIHEEACKILKLKLDTLLNLPPRMLVETRHGKHFFLSRNSLMFALRAYCFDLKKDPALTFDDWALETQLFYEAQLSKLFPGKLMACLRHWNYNLTVLPDACLRNYMNKAVRQMMFFGSSPGIYPEHVRMMDIGVSSTGNGTCVNRVQVGLWREVRKALAKYVHNNYNCFRS